MVDLDQRQVAARVGAHDMGGQGRGLTEQGDRHRVGPGHHMVVGQDLAPRGEDHAAPG